MNGETVLTVLTVSKAFFKSIKIRPVYVPLSIFRYQSLVLAIRAVTNKLSLNIVKTQSLIIGSGPNIRKIESEPDAPPFFSIGDQDIVMITNTRYLGVQIDSNLNWGKHIDTIKTKANRALGLIKYSRKYLPSDVLSEMYRGIVEPHLSYCCSVCGCCSESKIDVLQRIQNRAARIVTSSPYDASAPGGGVT